MENKAHHEPSKLPYRLLKQITNDFHEDRILGTGGFGTVYKGVYENRGEVAVKVLGNISGLDDTEFHREFDNLRGLKHPNIVELVGFCNESNEELVMYEGKQVTAERLSLALCFELVQNGSLNKQISDEKTGLTWQTRYRIIKGICEGLRYLRERKNPIMHFDLKPDNILLDENMKPKIADFGLSKLFGEENTRKAISSAGTNGYWPPEYIKHQIISREFDIFSLGVIIVRIMIGHKQYNSVVEMLARKSVKLVHENWRKRLRKTLSHTSLEVYCNQVKRCIEIALDCMIPNRQERPTIQDILYRLNETETMIGDQGMHNEQFYQDDGESTLPSDFSRITINSVPSSENFPAVEPKVMPLILLKKMTDDFSNERLLGRGVFADVYKGVQEDGRVIAVNKLHKTYMDGWFKNEIADLMKLRHRNILQFIGYCNETKDVIVEYKTRRVIAKENNKIMCFEYMESGSLDRYITTDMYDGLSWQSRYGILKGACEGLKYLHEELERYIIHMDLRPGNIFMDENMMPKIRGSAPFICSSYVGRSPPQRSSPEIVRMRGTRRYMPPEYIEKQVISKKFDIYSLGVIILELMTGRQSYDEFSEMPPHEFIELAYEKWRGRLQETVHVTLVEGYCQQVKKCLEIAFNCMEYKGSKRPAIGAIVDALNETEMLIPQDSEQLLEAHPLELCFFAAMPSLLQVPRKKKLSMVPSSSCLLQLENKGNDRVLFMLVANSPSRYLKMPLCGVVPPRCLFTLALTLMTKAHPLSMDSVRDFCTLNSVMAGQYELLNVDKDSVSIEYGNFFKKAREEAGHEVQEVNLKVLCCHQQTDHMATSSETTWSTTVEMIITTPHAKQVSSIDVHPSEPWIMTTHHTGILHVWNYHTMATMESVQDVTHEAVRVAKFIKQEKWVIAGAHNGYIYVYNYDEQEDIKSIDAHSSCITTLVAHPTHPLVISSSDDADHLIKIWDWGKGWECTKFQGHTGRVMQVTLNPKDSNSFASASLDGTVKIWNIRSNDPCNVITLKLKGPIGLEDRYVPEGLLCVDYFTRCEQEHLIVGCKDKTAQIWKMGMKECVHALEGHEDHISAVILHPEISVLITSSRDGTIRVWDSTTYKLNNIIALNLGAVNAFGCMKDSTRIVAGCDEGIAIIEIPRLNNHAVELWGNITMENQTHQATLSS